MIHSEWEYEQALVRLGVDRRRHSKERAELQGLGSSAAEMDRRMAPQETAATALANDIKGYLWLGVGSPGWL